MKIFEWLWSFLPDNCEIPRMHTYITCSRKGVRGNENIVLLNGKAIIVCDDCESKLRTKLNVNTPL